VLKIGIILNKIFPITSAVMSFALPLLFLCEDNTHREKFVHILWAPSLASRKDKIQLSFFAQQVLPELGALGAARLEAE
jgi:hypothetical protein